MPLRSLLPLLLPSCWTGFVIYADCSQWSTSPSEHRANANRDGIRETGDGHGVGQKGYGGRETTLGWDSCGEGIEDFLVLSTATAYERTTMAHLSSCPSLECGKRIHGPVLLTFFQDSSHVLQGKDLQEAHPSQGDPVQEGQGLARRPGKASLRP